MTPNKQTKIIAENILNQAIAQSTVLRGKSSNMAKNKLEDISRVVNQFVAEVVKNNGPETLLDKQFQKKMSEVVSDTIDNSRKAEATKLQKVRKVFVGSKHVSLKTYFHLDVLKNMRNAIGESQENINQVNDKEQTSINSMKPNYAAPKPEKGKKQVEAKEQSASMVMQLGSKEDLSMKTARTHVSRSRAIDNLAQKGSPEWIRQIARKAAQESSIQR